MEETIIETVEVMRVHTYQVTAIEPTEVVFTLSKTIRKERKTGCLELHYGDGILSAVKWREKQK